ncbi:ATP-grasp domain-containing protein [Candidatus Dependentiae bacterium]|jgi:hypothetical protein|nr:MAG: ATP-grasp domain-containing protein [Candidatus Dependentiae bacterium]
MRYYPNFFGGKSSKMKRYFRKNTNFPIGSPDRYPIKNCVFSYPVDVSFGSTKPSEPQRLRINTPSGIRISSSKTLTKDTIKEHCPVLLKYNHASRYIDARQTKLDLLEQEIGFPMVAKLKYGFGGKGMYFLNNAEDLQKFVAEIPPSKIREYFFEEYFLFTNEYRIHVSPLLKDKSIVYKYEYALKTPEGSWTVRSGGTHLRSNGEILGIEKKLRNPYAINPATRNFATGVVTFSSNFRKPEEWDKMVEASVKAAELMGLDFCCTDVMYNKHTRKFYISETNTNPGMDVIPDNPCPNVTAQHYQQALPHMIAEKYLRSVSARGLSRTYGRIAVVN